MQARQVAPVKGGGKLAEVTARALRNIDRARDCGLGNGLVTAQLAGGLLKTFSFQLPFLLYIGGGDFSTLS